VCVVNYDILSIKKWYTTARNYVAVLFHKVHARTAASYCIDTRIGCNIAGVMVNVLVYADDIVLLAPSWVALQFLIDILDYNIEHIGIVCNISKTVLVLLFKSVSLCLYDSALQTTFNAGSLDR